MAKVFLELSFLSLMMANSVLSAIFSGCTKSTQINIALLSIFNKLQTSNPAQKYVLIATRTSLNTSGFILSSQTRMKQSNLSISTMIPRGGFAGSSVYCKIRIKAFLPKFPQSVYRLDQFYIDSASLLFIEVTCQLFELKSD